MGDEDPRLNYYPNSPQPIASPAVASSLTKDLYLTLMAFDTEENHATIRAIVNPGVAWLWIGGGIIGLGAIIAMWPRRRSVIQTSGAALLATELGTGPPSYGDAVELDGEDAETAEVAAGAGEAAAKVGEA
jgi:cytochrome c-type biogenesis protein CcmF